MQVAAYLDWLKKFEGNFDQEAQTQLDNVDDVVQRRTCIMPAAVVKFAHAKMIAKYICHGTLNSVTN